MTLKISFFILNIRVRKTSANIVGHKRTVVWKVLAVFFSKNIYTGRKQGRACTTAWASCAPASDPAASSVRNRLAWETRDFDFFWFGSHSWRMVKFMLVTKILPRMSWSNLTKHQSEFPKSPSAPWFHSGWLNIVVELREYWPFSWLKICSRSW